MPTVNPRVPIMLTPHQHDVFKRLAKINGTSISKVIGEIIEACLGPMERALAIGEAAQRANQAVRDQILENAERAEQALAPILDQALAGMEQAEAHFQEMEKTVRARAPKKRPPGVASRREGARTAASKGVRRQSPPLSNHGGHNVTKSRKSKP